MLPKTLYAPTFPQMANDGVINLSELATSGVVIDVAEYENARKGDLVELWFESYAIDSLGLSDDPVSQYFPWQCNLAPAQAMSLPDGVYKVQYNQIDAALNNHWSDIGKVIIDRSSTGTLPPPLFPEAGSDNTLDYDDAMSNGGTPVTIPDYDGITQGDVVTLFWVGLRNGAVVQESITSVTHTVTTDDLSGFNVLIATAFIMPTGLDHARAWYVVQHNDTRNERSANGMVIINTSSGVSLPAPIFTEGNDDWIDADEASSDNGTPLHIPAYPGIGAGDIVTTHWQGYSPDGAPVSGASAEILSTVTPADVSDGLDVIIPTKNILPVGIGYGMGYYSVLFAAGNQGSSLAAEIGIDVIHTLELPAPGFTEALTDGVIDNTDAMSYGGTPVTVSYPAMAEGDNVTLSWSCYHQSDISPVAGTVYSSTHSVTATEAQQQLITFTVPSKYITPTGKGYAIANYSVSFHDGGIGYSDDGVVDIDTQGTVITGSDYLGGSTGFAPWDNTVIQNSYVKYFAADNGIPLRNIDINFTIYGNNYFTSNHQQSITVKTNLQGYAQTNISGSDTLTNTITAKIVGSSIPCSTLSLETERTNDISVPYLSSEPYMPGSGNRTFTLSVSENQGTYTLFTNNNADIYIDNINKGGYVSNITVTASAPLIFSVALNNLNNTVLTVAHSDPAKGNYCSFTF